MDFKSLKYFLAVAQEKNITRAAVSLNMSQPPLSSRIRSLEEEFGTELFWRTNKGLLLTPTGEILYRRAGQILELAQHTRKEIAAVDSELGGPLTIGTVEGGAPFLVAEWIRGFREEFPLVTYTLRSGGTEQLLDQLNRHQLDLAVIAAPYNQEELEGISVGRQPWMAMIPTEHPLAETGKTIRLEELEGEPLIIPERESRVQEIEKWFAENGATPRIIGKTSNYINALALVEQNVGICIFPKTSGAGKAKIVTRAITDPPRFAEYILAGQKDVPLTETAEAFLDYVRDYLENTQCR